MKAKVGDIAHVRCPVTRVGQPGSDVTGISIRGTEIWVADEDIVHVEPAPLKVGDHVIWPGREIGVNRTIIGIDLRYGNPMAWIRGQGDGPGAVVHLDQLERADEPRPLNVGDKVRHKDGMIGVISNIMNDIYVRVDTGGNCYGSIARFEDLERVE